MVILRCGQIHQRCRQQHDQPRLRKLRQRYEKEELCSMSSPLTVLLTHWPRLLFAGKYTSSSNQGSCTTWSSCAAGKYVSDGGTASSNRVCSTCDNGMMKTCLACYLLLFSTHTLIEPLFLCACAKENILPRPTRARARHGRPALLANTSAMQAAARTTEAAQIAAAVRG